MPKLASFLVSGRHHVEEVMEGHGLTVQDVVDQLAGHLGHNPDDREGWDWCIWSFDRVVAVVHVHGDTLGSYDVSYLDPAYRETTTPDPVEVEAEPEADDEGEPAIADRYYRPPFPPPRNPAPPPPLCRQTLTLDVPSDETTLTVDIIILAGGGAMDDEYPTAERWEVPELRQAGWHQHGVNNLYFYTRIIAT